MKIERCGDITIGTQIGKEEWWIDMMEVQKSLMEGERSLESCDIADVRLMTKKESELGFGFGERGRSQKKEEKKKRKKKEKLCFATKRKRLTKKDKT